MGAPVRRIALLALIQLVFLAACGGSSSDLSSGAGSASGSGSSTGSGGGQTIASAAANVTTLTVDAGPDGGINAFNIPYITVKICAPGSTTNCQTIDHVEVDTASYGLRIISSVLNSTLLAALPQETSAGIPIAECAVFGDGYSWGTMRTADLQVSSETAAGIPMAVLGDPSLPAAPQACQTAGMQVEEDTVNTFGANGIIGVGPFAQDCGTACVQNASAGYYYTCPTGGGTSSCALTTVALNQQAVNPVAAFATDNNGVIVELPSVPDAGAATVTGALVFGIGTQGNNSLGNAVVLTTDATYGDISISFSGSTYTDSFLDSGSNLIFFDFPSNSTAAIAQCSISNQSFYCPSSEQTLTAVNTGLNGVQSTVTFQVANAQTIFNNEPTFAAFDNVAAPSNMSSQFDFGLPFFYGRNVFTAIQGMNTSGGMGPYFAY